MYNVLYKCTMYRYPTLISADLGDRLGHSHLHLYWRDFPDGPGPNSIFRKVEIELLDLKDSRV